MTTSKFEIKKRAVARLRTKNTDALKRRLVTDQEILAAMAQPFTVIKGKRRWTL